MSSRYFYSKISAYLDDTCHEIVNKWEAALQLEPAAIYDVRVGVKRFRAMLRLLHFIRPDKINKHTAQELFRTVYPILGTIRDTQVQAELITSFSYLKSNFEFYHHYLEEKREEARCLLQGALQQFDLQQLTAIKKRIKLLLYHSDDHQTAYLLHAHLKEMKQKMYKQLKKKNEESMHKVRKQLKESMYIIETTCSPLPDFYPYMKRLGHQLGHWHDLTVMNQMLDEIENKEKSIVLSPEYLLLRKVARLQEEDERKKLQKKITKFLDKEYKTKDFTSFLPIKQEEK